MADATTSVTLANGHRNLVMHFTNVSDGSGEDQVPKVDISEIAATPRGKALSGVRIQKIYYNPNLMTVEITNGAFGNVMSLAGEGQVDFRPAGGVPVVGDLRFKTNNMDETEGAAPSYDILIYMTKVFA